MQSNEILKYCLEKGFLLDKEVLNVFSEFTDVESAKLIIGKIKNYTQQRIITKEVFFENKDKVNEFFLDLPGESQKKLEKLKINLGLTIKISKEVSSIQEKNEKDNFEKTIVLEEEMVLPEKKKILYEKIEVKNFVKHFKNRFEDMRVILQEHSELNNLVSINKISGVKQTVSLIGIILDKKVTKNKNILLEVEDLTGKIRLLISQKDKKLYEEAEELSLDSIIGFNGFGNREIVFVNDIVFPDAQILERKRSSADEYVLFLGDLHFGSNRFLKNGFLKFIDYLNGKVPNTPEVEKIKYIFIVGDLVTGIGNYPNQERDLEIFTLEEQFAAIADLLSKIRRDIKIIISPGNHDGVRLMEPQPPINEKYAWPLYNLKNVFLLENPSQIVIGKKKDFSGFEVLSYHGFSFPFYAGNVSHLIMKKAMNCPEEIIKYLLKNRHLAPTHASVQSFPSEKDGLLIRKVPDIFIAGHTHKCAVSYYNNILIVSTACWEAMTPYQEKFGNQPDHCKVPMFNLKTRAIKILDFEEEELKGGKMKNE